MHLLCWFHLRVFDQSLLLFGLWYGKEEDDADTVFYDAVLLEVEEEVVQQVDEDVAEPPLAAANAVEVEAADDYEQIDFGWAANEVDEVDEVGEDVQQPVIILQIPAEDDTAEQNNMAVAVAVVAIQVINPANNKKKSKMKRLQKQLSSDLSNYWDVTNSVVHHLESGSKLLLQSLVHITMPSVAVRRCVYNSYW